MDKRHNPGPPANTSWCIYHNGTGGWVPIGEFYKQPNGSMYTRGQSACACKECLRQLRRLRYQQDGETARTRYSTARASARKRKIEFALSFEEFSTIVSQPCTYGPPATAPEIRVGIDRKDNSKGYETGNCVPCCARHNQIKSDVFSHADMLDIIARYSSAQPCGNTLAGRRALQDCITVMFKTPITDLQASRLQQRAAYASLRHSVAR